MSVGKPALRLSTLCTTSWLTCSCCIPALRCHPAAVVALSLFDLRKRGMVSDCHLAGTNGKKLPEIRAHMAKAIGEKYPGSAFDLTVACYPGDTEVDPLAYKAALAALPKGSAVTIFTPDDTHFSIALDCVKAGMHVLVTKPIVKTLAEHMELAAAAEENNVLVAVEVSRQSVTQTPHGLLPGSQLAPVPTAHCRCRAVGFAGAQALGPHLQRRKGALARLR